MCIRDRAIDAGLESDTLTEESFAAVVQKAHVRRRSSDRESVG